MTFEQYLGEKKLKDSTRKKYLNAWYKGVNMKTVENHYCRYLSHICPGQSPESYRHDLNNKKFFNATMSAIDYEYKKGVATLVQSEAWSLRQKRVRKLFEIYDNNDNIFYIGAPGEISFAPKSVMEAEL